ncbi:salt tolerance down-regulator-domain-containing protein [Pisolithus marmoratus]|nr:salt tolerance down-regulator-domain-containing protein [Pisolithus marmoratus]
MSVLQPLRISYVELQSLKNVEFIELVVPGCRRRIRQQGKNLFREEFAQPLMIQGEVLSFSVHQKKSYSSSIPAVNDIQIDINDAVPAEDDYTPPNTGSPLATTKELLNQCSRFRILVAGQTGVGKSTLLNRVFGVSQASVEDFKPEKAGQQERTARAASKAPMSAHNYKHVHHRPLPPPSNASVTNKSRSNAASDSNKNFQNDNKIWSTRSTEERERIKEFWLGLGEDERRNLVKIEKDTILKKMKYQQKHNCSCAVCGRKRHAIEEELVVLYDAYYEELERYANHQQRYLSSGGTIPPPPGPGPFPGSVELDRNGVVIGYPQTKLSCYPPPTNRTALLTDGWKSPKAESDFEEDEDEFEDEDGYDEEEQSVDTCGRRPVNGTKLNDGDGMFNVGSSITVTGPSNILTVADDLLKNDAHKFLEMMDQLAAHRMQRKEETGADVVDGSEEDDEHEDEDEDEDSKEVMTEGQRVEEAKRMFSIFAARMFEARVLESYLERVALERQQQLLRELEFEDQLTKERQTKKKLQNQKKKDKRR